MEETLPSPEADPSPADTSLPPSSSKKRKYKHHDYPASLPEKLVFFHHLKREYPKEILISERQVYKHLNIAASSARTIIRQHIEPRTLQTRGRPAILDNDQIQSMINLIEVEGWCDRIFPWTQLAESAGIATTSVSEATISRSLHLQGYRKCETCRLIHLKREHRLARAEICQWIQNTWTEETLRRVRWGDDMHFGLRDPVASKKMEVVFVRRTGERFCEGCIRQGQKRAKIPREGGVKYHCWAMVGWNYKSNLYFWDSSRPDGKMTSEIYTQILERMVLPARSADPTMILGEEQDISHGVDLHSHTQSFRLQHNWQIGRDYYFNSPYSPELSPMESIWGIIKQRMKLEEWYTDRDVRDAVVREWERLSMEEVNREVGAAWERVRCVLVGREIA